MMQSYMQMLEVTKWMNPCKKLLLSMQNDITKLEEWADNLQIRFSATKCKAMHTGKDNINYSDSMKQDSKIYHSAVVLKNILVQLQIRI